MLRLKSLRLKPKSSSRLKPLFTNQISLSILTRGASLAVNLLKPSLGYLKQWLSSNLSLSALGLALLLTFISVPAHSVDSAYGINTEHNANFSPPIKDQAALAAPTTTLTDANQSQGSNLYLNTNSKFLDSDSNTRTNINNDLADMENDLAAFDSDLSGNAGDLGNLGSNPDKLSTLPTEDLLINLTTDSNFNIKATADIAIESSVKSIDSDQTKVECIATDSPNPAPLIQMGLLAGGFLMLSLNIGLWHYCHKLS